MSRWWRRFQLRRELRMVRRRIRREQGAERLDLTKLLALTRFEACLLQELRRA